MNKLNFSKNHEGIKQYLVLYFCYGFTFKFFNTDEELKNFITTCSSENNYIYEIIKINDFKHLFDCRNGNIDEFLKNMIWGN